MSFHDPTSELSRLNGDADRHEAFVSDETFAVLTLASEMFHASAGAFDVTIAPELVAWGYLPRLRSGSRHGTMADVELGPGRRVRFTRKLLIDLGGIAKGYAVDRAVDALREAGVSQGIVNAGGDLRVFGPHSALVHVRHPRTPHACVQLARVRESALATSALYFSRRRVRGRLVSPIVDHRGRVPCLETASVSVVAPTCAVADALTKVVLVRDADSSSVLQRFSASAIALEPDGRIVTLEAGRAE